MRHDRHSHIHPQIQFKRFFINLEYRIIYTNNT